MKKKVLLGILLILLSFCFITCDGSNLFHKMGLIEISKAETEGISNEMDTIIGDLVSGGFDISGVDLGDIKDNLNNILNSPGKLQDLNEALKEEQEGGDVLKTELDSLINDVLSDADVPQELKDLLDGMTSDGAEVSKGDALAILLIIDVVNQAMEIDFDDIENPTDFLAGENGDFVNEILTTMDTLGKIDESTSYLNIPEELSNPGKLLGLLQGMGGN